MARKLSRLSSCAKGGWIPTRSATPSTALVPQRKVGFPIPNAGLLLGFQGTKTARREGISSPFSDAGGCTSPQNSGWVTANINTSIKNAAEFDIYARKNQRRVNLRVKTCGPAESGFTFGFRPGAKIQTSGFGKDDFTILVRMGVTRQGDDYYVVPTAIVRKVLIALRAHYLGQRKRDGTERVDTGDIRLRFRESRGNDP